MNVYLDTKNEHPMEELYVVLSHDPDGNEGIVSAITPMGAMPMVFGHKRMLDAVRGQLDVMSKDTGRTLIIAKYKKCEVIEKITMAN
jgi:hypothetical protein